MKKFLSQLLFTFLILFSYQVYADVKTSLDALVKSDEDFIYDNYYQIQENQNSGYINLLKLEQYKTKFPIPAVPYNRDTHFGGWLRDDTNGNCLNTRGKVLVRDSVSSVSYTSSGCTVTYGEWNDPYTARTYSVANDIQIDHVVALKNAYMTGAHEWDFKKRCLYANYLGNNFHLLPVNGKENLKKSDYTPSGYVPPNKSYTCEFIKTWLNIKLIWSLRITPKEAQAITRIADENNCDTSGFEVSTDDLRTQRDYMAAHANLCSSANVMIEKF